MKVLMAQLAEKSNIPSLGIAGKQTLEPKTSPGVDMTWEEGNLHLRKGPHHFIIPGTHILSLKVE